MQTDPAGIAALKQAVEGLHGCRATYTETVQVYERAPTGETVWQGPVAVFAVEGHAKATRAYAWSEAGEGTKRRFYAILGLGPVEDATTAVQASIFAEARGLVAR